MNNRNQNRKTGMPAITLGRKKTVVADYVLRTLGGGDAARKEELFREFPELRAWADKIDRKVTRWHSMRGAAAFEGVGLAQFLGLTPEAYTMWVQGPMQMSQAEDGALTVAHLKPVGPLQTQAAKGARSIPGLEGLSVRAANCLRRMKPTLATRAAVLAAMLAGELHPEKVTCLNLGWATYREIRNWLGKELIEREMHRDGSATRTTATGRRIWLLPVSVDGRDAEAVKRALARMAAGDPPEFHSLKPLLLGIANAWEMRGP